MDFQFTFNKNKRVQITDEQYNNLYARYVPYLIRERIKRVQDMLSTCTDTNLKIFYSNAIKGLEDRLHG